MIAGGLNSTTSNQGELSAEGVNVQGDHEGYSLH
jgi:hypothetical protein